MNLWDKILGKQNLTVGLGISGFTQYRGSDGNLWPYFIVELEKYILPNKEDNPNSEIFEQYLDIREAAIQAINETLDDYIKEVEAHIGFYDKVKEWKNVFAPKVPEPPEVSAIRHQDLMSNIYNEVQKPQQIYVNYPQDKPPSDELLKKISEIKGVSEIFLSRGIRIPLERPK